MTMPTTFENAQDLLLNPSSMYASGFNRALHGEALPSVTEDTRVQQGYNHAKELIQDGKVFYVHNFHDLECKSKATLYGGFWCCDCCGKKGVDRDYWKIRIFKDGSEYCCVGENFVNIQESQNYGFGRTKKEAIESYFKSLPSFIKETK